MCNSVLYDTKTFLFLTFCFNDMLLKKRNDNSVSRQFCRFNTNFYAQFCIFAVFCVFVWGSGAFFEAISALKLRCLWWTRTFLQKNVILECGLFV